ncbi:MAG: hypothetical protein AAB332_03035, partial [Planctomycetota bacterium]
MVFNRVDKIKTLAIFLVFVLLFFNIREKQFLSAFSRDAFPNFCKLFVPVRTARNVNAVSLPTGLKILAYSPTDKSVG